MSDAKPQQRPRQLTMAGWFVILGSVFLVASVYDSLTNLNSVDMRAEIGRVLETGSGSGLGIGVDQAVSVMRVALLVAGACAAAAAVLGVYVLQRHRQARVALTVVAVPLLLTAPVTGGLFGALVAAATLTLWTGPARDWFAGRPVREQRTFRRSEAPAPEAPRPAPPASTPTARPPVPPVASAPSTTSPSASPGATHGFGRTEEQPVGVPPAWATSLQPPPDGRPDGPAVRRAVPTPVKVACLLTWVFSGGLTVLYGIAVLVLIATPDRLLEVIRDTPEWQRANLPEDVLLPGLWLATLVVLAWTISACVLAVLVWRCNNWARWLLAVSAGFALLLAMFAFPVGVPHQIACAVVIGALFGPTARAWFDHRP